ncbi:MAG: hypothetical protein M1281_16510 [Chloroflexi bacterium]|nr:hypothetical protein [Chloroflexota bacterium]
MTATEKIILAICLIVPMFLAVNAMLWSLYQRRKNPSRYGAPQRSSFHISQPWQKEDTALEELSKRVADLRNTDEPEQKREGSGPPTPGKE